jgi:hypothetical protein
MTWVPLLLADPSPNLRILALRDLLHRDKDDPEVHELIGLREKDPIVADLLRLQGADGSWKGGDIPGSTPGGKIQSTSQALIRLGYMGFGPDHQAVSRGAEYIFSRQRRDGAWELPENRRETEASEGYSMMPLQTTIPLRGLASCGYATDPRAERAYEWLISRRLPDGAWPTGIASGNYGYVAGYRRLAHSRWGCRSNTTGALICLALHPRHRISKESQRALDLLLGRETREKHTLGYEVARTIGVEPLSGFITYYARFDPAQVLDLCWRLGASLEDERVAELVEFVRGLRGPYGLWEYVSHPQASRWVTFDLLRSLSRLNETGDWISLEPRTPFQAYPKKERRY